MKPDRVARLQRNICAKAHCDFLDKLDYQDPCAVCPNGHWGPYTTCSNDALRSEPDVNLPFRIYVNPGDFFVIIIRKITGQQPCPNKCRERITQMNKWGWWKCWCNRKTIVSWLVEEARSRGHQITESNATDLLKAAFKELKHGRG